MIEKMNTDLEFILHKKHVILHLLQNASKKKDSLPIPVHLHRCVMWIFEAYINLLYLSNPLVFKGQGYNYKPEGWLS
jgi:hypothetical protein